MIDYIIKNGKVVSPEGTIETAIAVKDGKIIALGEEALMPSAERVIDAKGNYVIPGAIDAHVHVGWPDWEINEAYAQDTQEAAFGGVTTVIDRVTLPPGSLVEQIFGPGGRKESLENNSYVDVAMQGVLLTNEHIEEVPALLKEGICGFKFYLPYKGTEAVPPMVGIDDGMFFSVLRRFEVGYPSS